MTKLSGNRLKMSDGSIRKFKSSRARASFERAAQAVKHGWEYSGRRTKTGRKR